MKPFSSGLALLISVLSASFSIWAYIDNRSKYIQESRPFISFSTTDPGKDSPDYARFWIVSNSGATAARIKSMSINPIGGNSGASPVFGFEDLMLDTIEKIYENDDSFSSRLNSIRSSGGDPWVELRDSRLTSAYFTQTNKGELVIAPNSYDYFIGIDKNIVAQAGLLNVTSSLVGVSVNICYCNVSESRCWRYTHERPADDAVDAKCPSTSFVGCEPRQETPVRTCIDP